MAFIEWNDTFKINVEGVDQQHAHLVDLTNQFAEAKQKGKGSRIMNDLLSQLIGYTQEHFADEEKLMMEHDYPQLKRHQAQHRQLIQKVERFQFEFTQQHKRVTKDMMEFLKFWLTAHILKEDKEFGEYLSKSVEGAGPVAETDEPVPA